MILALIENGIVRNVVLGDLAQFPGAIDVTGVVPQPGIGWGYDGNTFTAPPPPPPVLVTQIERAGLLARMTPAEVHAWHRAMTRATATNTPVVADRNALYAWLRWESMRGDVDMASSDIQGLKSVWVALGMTQTRADALLAPLVQ